MAERGQDDPVPSVDDVDRRPAPTGPRPLHAVPGDDPLVGVYLDAELARIDHAARPPLAVIPGGAPDEPEALPPVPRYPVARRFGISGAMLAGAMMGVAEVLEPERDRTHQIEFAPDGLDEDEQLVTFHLVPGSPRASRLVIRPWLVDRFRR